jgi:O-methyltransferase
MRQAIKRMMFPLRRSLGRLVIPPERIGRVNPINSMTLLEKVAAFVAAEMVGGDYLEFGVFEGWGFGQAYHALEAAFEVRAEENAHNSSANDAHRRRAIWEGMRFVAFDSFQGLPALAGPDLGSADFRQGQYAAGRDVFLDKVRGHGVPLDRVVCVPGWFDATCTGATLSQHRISKAAVVQVDCDLYSSARSVLSFLEPVLQDGTVLIFDDWFSFRGNPRRGEQRAFAEWQEALRGRYTFAEYHREGYSRNSFIASRVLDD